MILALGDAFVVDFDDAAASLVGVSSLIAASAAAAVVCFDRAARGEVTTAASTSIRSTIGGGVDFGCFLKKLATDGGLEAEVAVEAPFLALLLAAAFFELISTRSVQQ